jgi:hypothetical protein
VCSDYRSIADEKRSKEERWGDLDEGGGICMDIR